MDTLRLIDAIVRQTTVLVAQLSTTAGIRAPLAHIADQVFLDLSRQIEAQGVSRKVAASMFGMALRGYQRKVQRLVESSSVRERTLWEAIVEHLQTKGSATRRELFGRFSSDGEEHVAAVLFDLRTSGIVYATGRGDAALYGLSSEADRERLLRASGAQKRRSLVWYSIYQKPQGLQHLANTLQMPLDETTSLVESLLDDGLITATPLPLQAESELQSERFLVPVGSEQGFEVAVFDHYRAVATAIAHKLMLKARRHPLADRVGGATLVFDLKAGHPMSEEVFGLLERVRDEVNAVWRRVSDYNRVHPIGEDERVQVSFYFGQNVEEDTRVIPPLDEPLESEAPDSTEDQQV